MKRCFLSVLMALLAASGAPAVAGDAAIAARMSVVIVSSHIGAHRDAIGAGVIVAVQPRHLLVVTAAHVTQYGPVTVWVDQRPFAAEKVRGFAHRDLAIVDATIPANERPLVRAAQVGGAFAAGDAVVMWGEDETGLRLARGRIVSSKFVAPDDPLRTVYLLSIACDRCARGDSGAGIFNADGFLIGVLVARYHTSDDRTAALVGEPLEASLLRTPDGESSALARARKPADGDAGIVLRQ